jgi:hypothetical protein
MGVITRKEKKKKVSKYIFFDIVFGGVVHDDLQFLQLLTDPNIISGEIFA